MDTTAERQPYQETETYRIGQIKTQWINRIFETHFPDSSEQKKIHTLKDGTVIVFEQTKDGRKIIHQSQNTPNSITVWEIYQGEYCEGSYITEENGDYERSRIAKPDHPLYVVDMMLKQKRQLSGVELKALYGSLPKKIMDSLDTFVVKLHPKIQKERAKLNKEEQEQFAWKDQMHRLVLFGFPQALGLSSDEYLQSLPPFQSQPEAIKGIYDTPLLVDPRVPLEQQLRLFRIENDFTEHDQLHHNVLPDHPYQIWVQDGKRYAGKSQEDVERAFGSNGRFIQALEGIALYREQPNIVDFDQDTNYTYNVAFGGTRNQNGESSHLLQWYYYWQRYYGEKEMRCGANLHPPGGWATAAITNI